MKLIHKFTAATLACAMMVSCTTTQTISVSGLAGTEIYTPDKTKVGTINNLGQADIILNSDAYYAYLLSKNEGSDQYIPFALDYKNHNYAATKFAKGTGYTLGCIGLGVMTLGTICLVAASSNESEDLQSVFGIMTGIGGGVGLIGAGIGAPADSRLEQTDHAYQFKYLPQQSTNQDFTFTKPQLITVTPQKASTPKVAKQVKDEASAKSKSSDSSSSKSTKKLNDKSTKSFKNYGAAVEGSYIGTGTLTLGGQVIESYKDIEVKITRVDNNSVEVSVVESNGAEFFSETSVYNIKKGSNNTFTLTHEDISKATIKIDNTQKAIYLHPRVNIDGDLYTLKITATLNK